MQPHLAVPPPSAAPHDPSMARALRVLAKRSAWLLAMGTAGIGLTGSGEVRLKPPAASLKIAMLAAHNVARQQVGLGPMVWSPALAADASIYAIQMARSQRFAHSGKVPGALPQGENLWMGTRGAYSFAEMAGSWVEERQHYDGGSISQALATGTFGNFGHYTQIIWRGTKSMGCAVASSATDDYLVCRYIPAGNVMGAGPLD